MATDAPCDSSMFAMARPIPRVPPVTRQTLPSIAFRTFSMNLRLELLGRLLRNTRTSLMSSVCERATHSVPALYRIERTSYPHARNYDDEYPRLCAKVKHYEFRRLGLIGPRVCQKRARLRQNAQNWPGPQPLPAPPAKPTQLEGRQWNRSSAGRQGAARCP